MKKIFLFLLIFVATNAKAQNVLPEYDKQEWGRDVPAGSVYLDADKNLCELKESINVNIRFMLADQEDGVPVVFNYNFKNPADAPWKVGEFKIVSGGAKIGITEGTTAQIIMPSSMPKEKAVIVQATLNPVAKGASQLQVFTTIYLEDNDNVFYFNCPYLNINNEKFIVQYNGGALASSDKAVKTAIDKKTPGAGHPIKEYTMKAASAEIMATEHGFDLSALTSNAKAIYAKDEDVTSIILNSDYVEMENGLKVTRKRMYMIALSIPGKKTGMFKIRSDKKITATVTFPKIMRGVACTCAEDPKDPDPDHKPPACMGGTITITKNDGKYIEGTVNAHLESQDYNINPPPTYFSRLTGKFRVPIAN